MGIVKRPCASVVVVPSCAPFTPFETANAVIDPPVIAPMNAVPLSPAAVPPAASCPFDPFRRSMSGCISAVGTPDLFMVEPMNRDIASASDVVPPVGCMLPPIIPPMPLIETGDEPIIPFMTPSAPSFIMAVTIPEDDVMPIVLAYSDIAAMAMPWFFMSCVAPVPEPATSGFIGVVCRMSPTMK